MFAKEAIRVPELLCIHCSKPILTGFAIALPDGGAAHRYCLSRQMRTSAIEAQGRAGELREIARAAVAEASRLLIGRARAVAACAICSRPLASGGHVFGASGLVHTLCWRERGEGRAH